jgi:hypothetical protein
MNTSPIALDARASVHRTHDRAGARSLDARASAFFDDLGLVVYGLAAVVAIVLLWTGQS